MKKKLMRLLIWCSILGLLFLGTMVSELQKVKADTLPTIQFATTNSAQGSEKLADPDIKVLLSEALTEEVTVQYAVVDSDTDAVSGIDYILTGDTLTFENGQLSQTLPLQILDDEQLSPADKTITIELSDPEPVSAVELGVNKVFTYTITEDNTPVTTLTKKPAAAMGLNGWFTSKPTITLTPDRIATTYYQWDAREDGQWLPDWLTYIEPIQAEEGDHTLYYYSDGGDSLVFYPEEYQSETFKVDTQAPVWPQGQNLWAEVDSGGHIKLSWNSVPDADHYEIWRASSPYQLIASEVVGTSYLDDTISGGNQYYYQVIAVDQAGNKSLAAEVSIFAPIIEKQVSETLSASTEITPTIGEAAITQEVQGETNEEPKATEVAKNIEQPGQNQTETRNWNRLLLAISILIIAAGAAIGGYYGYEWWMVRKEERFKDSKPRSKSRW